MFDRKRIDRKSNFHSIFVAMVTAAVHCRVPPGGTERHGRDRRLDPASGDFTAGTERVGRHCQGQFKVMTGVSVGDILSVIVSVSVMTFKIMLITPS